MKFTFETDKPMKLDGYLGSVNHCKVFCKFGMPAESLVCTGLAQTEHGMSVTLTPTEDLGLTKQEIEARRHVDFTIFSDWEQTSGDPICMGIHPEVVTSGGKLQPDNKTRMAYVRRESQFRCEGCEEVLDKTVVQQPEYVVEAP